MCNAQGTRARLRDALKRYPIAYRLARRAEALQRRVWGTYKLDQSLTNVVDALPQKGAQLRQAIADYNAAHGWPFDPIRVVHLFQQLEAANALPPGDYVELGVHKGFALKVIHRFMDPGRTLFALDTFEGFDNRDLSIEATHYASPWQVGNFTPTSVERVGAYVGGGACPSNLKIVKGWFPESFHGLEDRRWRFVHIDFDLYQPIKIALRTLWPALLPGGVVIVHDYGNYGFPAARQAVDEFCDTVGVYPIQFGDRWGSVGLRKPRNA
ncbi:MAG TPA: TylF/MycF/NovP-related O-methyltransferase [Acetobacteraceae bacterium]|jgi:O-methyltransferase|nr:TylF/MycF/NovP-related O-methyltransferase [Acetobacteraceae bacterium]